MRSTGSPPGCEGPSAARGSRGGDGDRHADQVGSILEEQLLGTHGRTWRQ